MIYRIDFDLSGAIQMFQKSQELATDKGLIALTQRAEKEIEQLKTQTDLLQKMINQSPDMYEQMQSNLLLSYMEKAQILVKRSDYEQKSN